MKGKRVVRWDIPTSGAIEIEHAREDEYDHEYEYEGEYDGEARSDSPSLLRFALIRVPPIQPSFASPS
jgi:hypothetical protein